MADVKTVKDLVSYVGDALAAYPEEYSASDLLSTFATLLTATARVIIDKAPSARLGVVGIVQHLLLIFTEVTDPKKVH